MESTSAHPRPNGRDSEKITMNPGFVDLSPNLGKGLILHTAWTAAFSATLIAKALGQTSAMRAGRS